MFKDLSRELFASYWLEGEATLVFRRNGLDVYVLAPAEKVNDERERANKFRGRIVLMIDRDEVMEKVGKVALVTQWIRALLRI